jgi:hypothetical protein
MCCLRWGHMWYLLQLGMHGVAVGISRAPDACQWNACPLAQHSTRHTQWASIHKWPQCLPPVVYKVCNNSVKAVWCLCQQGRQVAS